MSDQQPPYGAPPPYDPPPTGYGPPPGGPPQPAENGKAKAAMVVGVIAAIPVWLVICPLLGLVLGATAIVLAVMARSEIARTLQAGAGQAKTGLICGIVGCVWGVAGMVIGVAVLRS